MKRVRMATFRDLDLFAKITTIMITIVCFSPMFIVYGVVIYEALRIHKIIGN